MASWTHHINPNDQSYGTNSAIRFSGSLKMVDDGHWLRLTPGTSRVTLSKVRNQDTYIATYALKASQPLVLA